MKTAVRFLILLITLIILSTRAFAVHCNEILSLVKEGDIVFTAPDHKLYHEIAEATNTWTSHVGIAFKDKDNWIVKESRVPRATNTSLCQFLKRTTDDQVALARLPKLKPKQANAIKKVAASQIGRWYDFGFDFDNKTRSFCSKFVYNSFLKAIGIPIGQIQTFADIFAKNPKGNLIFWQRFFFFFGERPSGSKTDDYTFWESLFQQIPWERRTVTPASQYNDPQLKIIYEFIQEYNL